MYIFLEEPYLNDNYHLKREQEFIQILQEKFNLTNYYGIKIDNNRYSFERKHVSLMCSRKVYKFDEQGNLLNKYNSFLEAAKDNNMRTTGIHQSIKNQIKGGGYLWGLDPKLNYFYKNKKGMHEAKKCYLYDLIGNFIKEFDCIRDMEKFLNLKPGVGATAIQRKTIIKKKWRAFYERINSLPVKPTPHCSISVDIYKNNGFLITCSTIKNACEFLNVTPIFFKRRRKNIPIKIKCDFGLLSCIYSSISDLIKFINFTPLFFKDFI
jgi:hypothetical protein